MTLEQDDVEALTISFMNAINQHYREHDTTRDRVLEVLNALAVTTAVVLGGTEDDPKAREFFDLALTNQAADLKVERQLKPEENRQ